MVDQRIFSSDPIAYIAKLDSHQTSVVSVIQNLKDATSEFVASSSKRQKLLEAKLTSFAAIEQAMAIKQAEMNDMMKAMTSKKDIMGANLKVVLDLLKKPYA